MDRGAWEPPVHGVTKSQTQLSTRAHKHVNSVPTKQLANFKILDDALCFCGLHLPIHERLGKDYTNVVKHWQTHT